MPPAVAEPPKKPAAAPRPKSGAADLSSPSGLPTAERFVFDDVDWDFYIDVTDRVHRTRPSVRTTFYKGRLELVTKSAPHDLFCRILYRMVVGTAVASGIPLRSFGSSTIRRKGEQAGFEGDEVFYVGDAASAIQPKVEAIFEMAKRPRDEREIIYIDLEVDPAPNLVVEVEITNPLKDRMNLYRDEGVAEVWHYADGLRVLALGDDGDYNAVECSRLLPALSVLDLNDWFVRYGPYTDTELDEQFRHAVRAAVGGGGG